MNQPNQFPPFSGLSGLEVTQNSPPDLSVLVNCNTAVNNLGGGIAPISGITQVALTLPGSNSYWACVYYDTLNLAFGVTYGATGTTPTIRLPNFLSQVPLAAILLSTTTTAVTPGMIVNLQSPTISPGIVTAFNNAAAASVTINCAGANVVYFSIASGNTTLSIVLSNIRIGVVVFGKVRNASGAQACTLTFSGSGGTPDGTTFTGGAGINGKVAGALAAIDFVNTGISIPANGNQFLMGGTGQREDGLIPFMELGIF